MTEPTPDNVPAPSNVKLGAKVDRIEDISIEQITKGAVPAVWPYVEDMIRDAVNSSDVLAKLETPQDIAARLVKGDYGLFLVMGGGEIKAAIVMSVTHMPRTSICDIHYAGGSGLKTWINKFHSYCVELGRNSNCRFLRIEGRFGWIEELKKLGFKETSKVFTLEI